MPIDRRRCYNSSVMIKATIIDRFDLGYILQLEDGRQSQLRVIEMQGLCLQCHLDGREPELFGTLIEVDVVDETDDFIWLSQFTSDERRQRQLESDRKEEANSACRIGQTFRVRLSRVLDWGCIFEQVDGDLEGGVHNRNNPSNIAWAVDSDMSVRVCQIQDNGRPVFEAIASA